MAKHVEPLYNHETYKAKLSMEWMRKNQDKYLHKILLISKEKEFTEGNKHMVVLTTGLTEGTIFKDLMYAAGSSMMYEDATLIMSEINKSIELHSCSVKVSKSDEKFKQICHYDVNENEFILHALLPEEWKLMIAESNLELCKSKEKYNKYIPEWEEAVSILTK